MTDIYKIFSKELSSPLSFSEDNLVEMFKYETYGIKSESLKDNGFYVGKQYMDLHITTWREDLRKGLLLERELYEDGTFPSWWLDKVLKGWTHDTK